MKFIISTLLKLFEIDDHSLCKVDIDHYRNWIELHVKPITLTYFICNGD